MQQIVNMKYLIIIQKLRIELKKNIKKIINLTIISLILISIVSIVIYICLSFYQYLFNSKVKEYDGYNDLDICLVGTKEFNFYPYLSIIESNNNILFKIGVM